MNACLASTSFSPTEKLCQIQLAFDEINRVCCDLSITALESVFSQFNSLIFCRPY